MVGVGVAVNVAVGVGVAVGVAVAVGVGVCVGASAKTFHAVVGPYARSEKTAATSTAAINATAPPTRRNSARRVIVPLPSSCTAIPSLIATLDCYRKLTESPQFAQWDD